MKNQDRIKQLECYNEEFLKLYHSKNARKKRNIKKIQNSSIKDCIRLVKKKITAKIGDLRIKKNTISKMQKKEFYNFGEPMDGIKVAVYTCITNGYDTVKEPIYIDNDTDYYLFTDSMHKGNKNSIWKNKIIDCEEYEDEANRYYKFHPDIFKKDYDFAIYIDGNVKVVSDVTTICSIAREAKTGIAMHEHHLRDCAYEEGKACKYYKRGNQEKIKEALLKMKKEGFPERFGLCEATIIVYDLKNKNAIKISHEWWDLYYNSKTKRDQIFLPYVLWKNGYEINDIGNLGNDVWKNPKFILGGHD